MEQTTYKQVGSTCLKEFTGVDPTWAANAFTFMDDLGSLTDDSKFGGFDGVPQQYDMRVAVAAACTAVRHFGWVKASAYEGTPTKSEMAIILSHGGRKHFGVLVPAIEDEDYAQADLVIAQVVESTDNSDYAHNLRVAVAHETAQPQHYGLLAAAVGMYSVNQAKIVSAREKAAAEAEKSNEWIGEIKERLDLTLTVVSVSERPGYGYDSVTYLTKLEDEAGNAFTWWGSYGLDEGKTYTGKWTVKKHTTFNDRNETVINRPAKNLTEK